MKNSNAGLQWTQQIMQYLLLSFTVFGFACTFHWSKHPVKEDDQHRHPQCWDVNLFERGIPVSDCSFLSELNLSQLAAWSLVSLAWWYQSTVKWWKEACVYFSAVSQVCDPSKNWDGANLLGSLCPAQPSLDCDTWDPGFISLPSPANERNYSVTFPRSFYIN